MKTRLLLPLVLLCVTLCLSGCQLLRLGGLLPEPTESPIDGPCVGPLPLPGDLVYLSFSEGSSYFKRVQGYDFRAEDADYFNQPGNLFVLMSSEEQQRLFQNTARAMNGVERHIMIRHITHCYKADPAYGKGVAAALGVPMSEVPV